jgi:predicted nuclease of predicted toxin-antitoxin system
MKILLDENMSRRELAQRLLSAGHDVTLVVDEGLRSASDPRVFRQAIAQDRSILTMDYGDFTELHDLIVVAKGRHAGVLIVRGDNDSSRDMKDRAITLAIDRLEASGLMIADQIHVLNHWQ